MMDNRFLPTLIRASAGTGKTYSLTNRFIALLVAGEKIERILATTFTKKAAGEILERVLLRIARAAQSREEAQNLATAINDKQFCQDKAVSLLLQFVTNQHRVQISTLDSFFSRIAKAFPLELSIPLIWEIADPERVVELRSEALEIVFQQTKGNEGREQFLELLKMFQSAGVGSRLNSTLDKVASEMYSVFRSSQVGAWLQIDPAGGNCLPTEILVEKLKGLDLPRTKKGEVSKPWSKAIDSLCEELLSPNPDFDEILNKGIAPKIISQENNFSRQEIPEEIISVFLEVIKLSRHELLVSLKSRTEALYAFLCKFEEAFSKVKSDKGILLFDDVKYALVQHGRFDEIGELYFRLDSTLRHILLDEFQDTSVDEWRVIDPLVDEVLAHADGEHSFFCVGDVKQAIYGWRGGESAIFDVLENQFPQLQNISMDHSFRSSGVVIDVVNQIFGNLERSEVLSAYPEVLSYWQRRFKNHSAENDNLAGYVTLDVVGSNKASAEEQRTLADAKTVELVERIREQNPTASIAILYRRNKPIARMIYHLKRRNIAASEEGGNPLTDSKAVTIMLSLLRLAQHPGDGVARFCIAESPLGKELGWSGVGDLSKARKLSVLTREMVASQGLCKTLEHFAESLWSNLDERETERLLLFLEEAMTFKFKRNGLFSEFVSYIESKKVDSSSQGIVRVMNVHQSKGLEFDAVILPELDMSLNGQTPRFLSERDSLIGAVSFVTAYPGKALLGVDPKLKQMAYQHQLETISESLALLYVALTRARHAIHMIVTDGEAATKQKLKHSGILLELLSSSGQELGGDLTGRYFELGDSSWKSRNVEGQSFDNASAAVSIPALITPEKREKHLFSKAPSHLLLDTAKKDIFKNAVNPRSRDALERGSILHALFEQVSWLEESDLTHENLQLKLSREFSHSEHLDSCLNEFFDMISRPTVKAILSKKVGSVKLYRELPFAFREAETIYRGVIDRLTISDEGEINLIDFKTDQIQQDQAEERAAKYAPQIEIYQKAAARFFQVDRTEVKSSLLFVACDKQVLVS